MVVATSWSFLFCAPELRQKLKAWYWISFRTAIIELNTIHRVLHWCTLLPCTDLSCAKDNHFQKVITVFYAQPARSTQISTLTILPSRDIKMTPIMWWTTIPLWPDQCRINIMLMNCTASPHLSCVHHKWLRLCVPKASSPPTVPSYLHRKIEDSGMELYIASAF